MQAGGSRPQHHKPTLGRQSIHVDSLTAERYTQPHDGENATQIGGDCIC